MVLSSGVEPLLLLLLRVYDMFLITEFTIEMMGTNNLPLKPAQTLSLKIRPTVKVLLLKPM